MSGSAWVAAAVSVTGAVLAWLSARRASRLSDSIDRRRHLVDEHDREVAELRTSFAGLLSALGAVNKTMDLKAALFSVEPVLIHPLCTPELEASVTSVVQAWTLAFAARANPGVPFDDLIKAMRTEMRAINEAAAARRRALVGELSQ